MHWPPAPSVALHLACGSAALLAGALALLARKGGRGHRRAGRIAAVLGGITGATAALGIALSPVPPALAAVTLSACYQLASSVRSLQLRGARPGAFDALLACAALVCVAMIACWRGTATSSFSPAIEWSALGFVSLVATYDLCRLVLSDEGWRRLRPLDHGLKMIGFYAGMASAGLGNLLPFAQPWSSVVPSVAGTLGMLYVAFLRPVGRRSLGLAADDGMAPRIA